MVIAKIPKLIQYLLYYFEFKIKGENKTLYLTFDDGPIPEVTPEVLDILEKLGIKTLRTDEKGDLVFIASQSGLKYVEK